MKVKVLTGTLAILMQLASVKLTNTPALNIYMYYLHVYVLQIYFFLFLACLNSNPTLRHVENIYYSTFVEKVILKITRSYRYFMDIVTCLFLLIHSSHSH